MTPAPKPKSGFEWNIKTIVAITAILSFLFGIAGWVSSVAADAHQAKHDVEILQESTVKRDDFKELKEDLKALGDKLDRYMMEDRQARQQADYQRTPGHGRP